MSLSRLVIGALASVLIFTVAKADIISSTPTLPLLGAAFATGGAGSCFPAAGVCAEPGTLTFDSVVSSPPAPPPFNQAGQDILVNATLTGVLTDLSHATIATLLLTGTIEMEIVGRTFPTQTGSWPIELLALNLEGPVLGHTLTIGLDTSTPSTGMASIDPVGSEFRISSFFDIFAELSLDTPTPLHTTRQAHFELADSPTAVPEPSSLALLLGAVVGLAALRRRQRAP